MFARPPSALLVRAHGGVVDLARGCVRLLTWTAQRVTPTGRHVVVHGWPDSEGNALEVLRALSRRYPGQVVWLLNDRDYAPVPSVAADLGAVRRLGRETVRGWWVAMTAEATFFTHGLFSSYRPARRRLVVNVWHGDGPKGLSDNRSFRSTVVVAGTRLWGAARPKRFDLRPEDVAIVGNPRIDQMVEPVDEHRLGLLGLDPSRGLVLWLPTFRAGTGPRRLSWHDSHALGHNDGFAEVVAAAREAATRHRLHVVIKPHPHDVDRFEGAGLPIVTDADLTRAGLTLYQLLGRASAVISDVSSVWTDFLGLDRPVGFYVPDLEQLRASRGFNVPDPEALLPGPRVETAAAMTDFLDGVARGDERLRPSRHAAYELIGPARPGGAADRLLDWLDDYQRRHGRPALFGPGR